MAEDISRLKIEKPAGRRGYGRRTRRYLVWVAAVAALALALFLAAGPAQAPAGRKAAGENLAGARAELEDSRQDFERKRELLDGGFVSRSVFDMAEARFKKAAAAFEAAQAQVNSAQAALRGARGSLGELEVRAPFSGVVLTKNADIGDIVTPLGASAGAKAAVVTIADMDTLQVEADVYGDDS